MTQSQSFKAARRQAAGVSLIEALVALAVMSFGMLGVVGMQSTMRAGADISRQRSEAVRIAQEELEELRNYSVLRAADVASGSGQLAFDQIVAAAPASVPATNTNTTFILETLVPAATASDAMATVRQVRTIVTWSDRSASTPNQRVELSTTIAGLPAELSALHATRTDRSLLSLPFGRNAGIPRGAVNNGDGTSTFTPPGLTGVTWLFDNNSGLLKRCAPLCTAGSFDRALLSGYVAFATGTAPNPAEASIPVDPVVPLAMQVNVTLPPSTPVQDCATESVGADRLAYYCAIPTQLATGGRRWSGRVVFSTLALSGTLADKAPGNYKICRYTPDKVNRVDPTAVNLGPPSSDVPSGQTVSAYNSRHPYAYHLVVNPQANKNFLVISAGDGTTAYECPGEDPSTPIESNTWPHQPIS
jgi:Tfp pilus assembly protein PilV